MSMFSAIARVAYSWVTWAPASIAQVTSFRSAASRVRGVGGADRPGPGLHRLDHRDHLAAADLADDLPRQVEPERVVQAPHPG